MNGALPLRFAFSFLILQTSNTSATTTIIEILLNAIRPYVAFLKFDVVFRGVESLVATIKTSL